MRAVPASGSARDPRVPTRATDLAYMSDIYKRKQSGVNKGQCTVESETDLCDLSSASPLSRSREAPRDSADRRDPRMDPRDRASARAACVEVEAVDWGPRDEVPRGAASGTETREPSTYSA